MDDVASSARAAIRDGNRDRLRLLLHPYLQWTLPDGTALRGRRNVMAMLEDTAAPDAPAAVELRDGQIYRWHSRSSG